MAKFFDELTPKLIDFIREQKLFFTGSAPAEGRVNVSPKGMDCLRVIDEQTVAYLDLTGSGNETSAHLRENERLTLMFCSFTEKPLILRLYGRGRVVRPSDDEWDGWKAWFPTYPGQRQIIILDIESCQTSCGFAVPRYDWIEDRPMLVEWAAKRDDESLRAYRRENNRLSIDGLPTGLNEEQLP